MGGCAGQGNSEMAIWGHQSIADGQSGQAPLCPTMSNLGPWGWGPSVGMGRNWGVPAHTSTEKGTGLRVLLQHLPQAPPVPCGAELCGNSSPWPSALPRGGLTYDWLPPTHPTTPWKE